MSAVLTMPMRNDLPRYQFKITLSGIIYTVLMSYNTRMARWIMNINDASGNPILEGIPCLILRNLTQQYITLNIPAGQLFVTDDTGTDTQPTQYSFGQTNTMWYNDPDQ